MCDSDSDSSISNFFGCRPFLKSLLNLLQYCFCFIFWFFGPWDMWDLRSPSKDWTHSLCLERRSLSHCTTREVPQLFIKAFSSWLWQRLKGEECFSGLLRCYSVLTACWLPAREDSCLSCHYRPGSRRPHCPSEETGGSNGSKQAKSPGVCSHSDALSLWPSNPCFFKVRSEADQQTHHLRVC